MIDNTLTENMQAWLAADSHDRASVMEGAEMMFKLNRNAAMYHTVMRRPERFVSKIRYELQKFLPMRLEQQTLQDVKALDRELMPEVKAAIDEETKASGDNADNNAADGSLPAASGIRPDHDSLPDEVRSIWTDNRERWKRIRQLYNTLLAIEQPCDRYEYLKQLKDTWYTYKSELERYDSYVAPAEGEGNAAPSPSDIAKDIANARAYITKNTGRLDELHRKALAATDDDTQAVPAYNDLLAKMQQRVALLADNGAPVGDDLKDRLREAGMTLDT